MPTRVFGSRTVTLPEACAFAALAVTQPVHIDDGTLGGAKAQWPTGAPGGGSRPLTL
jgi:hypothetical protein